MTMDTILALVVILLLLFLVACLYRIANSIENGWMTNEEREAYFEYRKRNKCK